MAIPAKLSIGREPGNDVVVDHPSVSRKHAEMVRNQDGSVDIFDTTSSVGTYALHEGRWIKFQHATVGPDETIRLGEFETTPAMLLAAYRDPFDRTTERGPKPIETRRDAERRLGSGPADRPPNPQPPPGALAEDAFRPPEAARPQPKPPVRQSPPPARRPQPPAAHPPPTLSDAPPMAAAPAPRAPGQAPAGADGEAKSPTLAYLLWFFLGTLGAHRFYLGAFVSGVLQALLLLIGVGLLVGLTLLDRRTAAVLAATVPLTLLALWWLVDGFLTNDMVKKRNAAMDLSG